MKVLHVSVDYDELIPSVQELSKLADKHKIVFQLGLHTGACAMAIAAHDDNSAVKALATQSFYMATAVLEHLGLSKEEITRLFNACDTVLSEKALQIHQELDNTLPQSES